MKVFRIIAVVAVIIAICFCEQPDRPTVEDDVLKYSVDCSDSSLLADIKYLDCCNNLVTLGDQALPWSVSITLEPTFTGDAYLNAQISENQVFVPYMAGTADPAPEIKKLNDADKDFIAAGVLPGDKIYIDSTAIEYAEVVSVTDETTLFLNTHLFDTGSESYSIYHSKTLSSVITFNDEVAGEEAAESEKLLSCSVAAVVDYEK